jgi:hypothetical protein
MSVLTCWSIPQNPRSSLPYVVIVTQFVTHQRHDDCCWPLSAACQAPSHHRKTKPANVRLAGTLTSASPDVLSGSCCARLRPVMSKIVHVVSARPNFMKVAPVYRAIARRGNLAQSIVHTGQHYDINMSGVFLDDLDLPVPGIDLGVGSGSHVEQTAKTMLGLEHAWVTERPSLVSVVGDTNGAMSAALVAAKMGIVVAHVEAGLRSFDRRMPEEINRVVVDHVSDLLFTPSPDANDNLAREGVDSRRVHYVGLGYPCNRRMPGQLFLLAVRWLALQARTASLRLRRRR